MAHFCTSESNRAWLGQFVNNPHGLARGHFETYDPAMLTETRDVKIQIEKFDFTLFITWDMFERRKVGQILRGG